MLPGITGDLAQSSRTEEIGEGKRQNYDSWSVGENHQAGFSVQKGKLQSTYVTAETLRVCSVTANGGADSQDVETTRLPHTWARSH